MNESTDALISTGGLARRLGVSLSLIARLERQGVIPAGTVVEGSKRKVWRGDQLPTIREQFEARRQRTQVA